MTDSDTKMTCVHCGVTEGEHFHLPSYCSPYMTGPGAQRFTPAEPLPVAQAADDCPMCESDCPGGAHRNALHEAGIKTKEQYRQACASEPEKPPIPGVTYFVHRKDGSMQSSDDVFRRDYVSYQDFCVINENLTTALSQVAELTAERDRLQSRADQLHTEKLLREAVDDALEDR